jgi:hypothetical protein
MSNFHIRVELHRATGEDYIKLHQLMQAAGFSRTVAGSQGKVELPTGTYWYSGASTDGSAICTRVAEIAAQVKPNPAPYVFVSGDGTSGHTWWSRNLPPAR